MCFLHSLTYKTHCENANNKDADQPVHLRSVISTLVVCCTSSYHKPVAAVASFKWLYG